MKKFLSILTLLLLSCGSAQPCYAQDNALTDMSRAFSSAGIATHSYVHSNASLALSAQSFVAGTNATKGVIGEAIANRLVETMLQKSGSWHAISPRIGAQGLDHIYIKIDSKTGNPRDLIVGESKFNTSQLGMTKDGRQGSSRWINKRLKAMGNRYKRLSNVSVVGEKPFFGKVHEMKVILKNGKEVSFWRKDSKSPWKFSGSQSELAEAQQKAKSYGEYLCGAGEGRVTYRSRLFRIIPKGNDLEIVIKNLNPQNAAQKAGEVTISLKGALNSKVPGDIKKTMADALKSKLGLSDEEVIKTVEKVFKNMSLEDLITPQTRSDMMKAAWSAGTASITAGLVAAGLDAVIQFVTTRDIDPEKLLFTGGAVSAGTFAVQALETAVIRYAAKQNLFRSLGCSASSVHVIFAAGSGVLTGLLLSYGGYFMGYNDLTAANRMMLTSLPGIAIPCLPGAATYLISTFGTASTGTPIALLHGAAASKAAAYWLGSCFGGGAKLGAAILTSGPTIAAVLAIGGLVRIGFSMRSSYCNGKEETARLERLGELLSSPWAINELIQNAAI